ncbi:MAG: hypothetical protein Q4D06_02630 [Coriobacteriia bacterium]|nr:hypothetical protein [Coriobacteriia bacterium]
MAETTAYSCPHCQATLKLDPATGMLGCEYCGSSFTVEEIEARVDRSAERARAQAEVAKNEAKRKAKKTKKQQEQENLMLPEEVLQAMVSRTVDDWEELIASGQAEQFQDVVGYTCPNCGAEVVTDQVTVAASCQYCGSSVVVDQRLTGGLKPGFVIPFKVHAKELPDRLTNFYKDKPLLPKNFFYENQVGEVQGMYVPFWLYDGKVNGAASYSSSTSRSWRSGNDLVTETTHYKHERVGHVTFSHVPVDASERMDDDLMDSIEPFHYKDMKPFAPGYLTGFVAERFDQSPRQVLERAKGRMEKTTAELFDRSVPGGTRNQGSFGSGGMAASYVLLPVYLFNCKYMGKMYRYAVNGQTGKIVGEVPIGKRESLMAFLKPALLWTAVGAVALSLMFLMDFL